MAWISYEVAPDSPYTTLDFLAAFGLLLFICYLFIGIAFASDIFMNAIERICGSTRTVQITKEEDGVIVTSTKVMPVWNDTVANLTLMALGSSAPEILLSMIETIVGLGKQHPGDLGPGTIVGSAAYNLMVITAVCILSVGDDRTSRIKMYRVFMVTAVVSLFAYVWMVIVLQWNSRDQVDVWEAALTFIFFPLLVLVAYWAHHDFCVKGKDRRVSTASSIPSENEQERGFYFGNENDDLYDLDGHVDKDKLKLLFKQLNDIADLTKDEIALILATKLIQGKQHTRMWYRTQMTQSLMGGAKLLPVLNEKLQEVSDALDSGRRSQDVAPSPTILRAAVSSVATYSKKAVIEFQAATLAVAERIGTFNVIIFRTGKNDVGVKIKVESYDGSAKKNAQYKPVKEEVAFEPYVMENTVKVEVMDNVQWNPDSNFFLKLSILPESKETAVAGQTSVVEIIIQDDDNPGKLGFNKRGYLFKSNQKLGYVEVVRHNGTDGIVSVQWKVIPGPNCKIVAEQTGKLVFQHKEMKKVIEIRMTPPAEGEAVEGNQETFEVELSSPDGGAKLGKVPKTTCAVTSDKKFKLEIKDAMSAAIELSEAAEEEVSYKDQIVKSVKVNGGDTANATGKDWFLHIFTFPLKVSLSLIPPTHIYGGYPTFVIALCAVGLLTKVVGDSASAFGNAIRLDPVITAITIVALGTSLPDTFASRISAINDKTADNAVGNVTGSNSVNVFLGLGIPWLIGSIYYFVKDGGKEPYCVPAGSLTFNVLVYSMCATLTIAILTIRRYSRNCGQAELGGPTKTKWLTALFMLFLWIFYIALSSAQILLESKKNIDISQVFKGDTTPSKCAQIVARNRGQDI